MSECLAWRQRYISCEGESMTKTPEELVLLKYLSVVLVLLTNWCSVRCLRRLSNFSSLINVSAAPRGRVERERRTEAQPNTALPCITRLLDAKMRVKVNNRFQRTLLQGENHFPILNKSKCFVCNKHIRMFKTPSRWNISAAYIAFQDL